MKKFIDVFNINLDHFVGKVKVELPSLCPHCSTAYGEMPQSSFLYHPECNAEKILNMSSIFYCPHCGNCFTVQYIVHEASDFYSGFIVKTFPEIHVATHFSKQLSEMSPDFIELYHQAETAEHSGLSRICGMAYRKALEFLVKDYACFHNPDETEKILKATLSRCISDFILDSRIKTLALASAWLGNDETHYLKKHEEYNYQDLKSFILTLIAYVEYEFQYLKAQTLLESK